MTKGHAIIQANYQCRYLASLWKLVRLNHRFVTIGDHHWDTKFLFKLDIKCLY